MLTQLAVVARRTGYPVIEVPGWRTRTTTDEHGRPEQMTSVEGVTCHHTANGGARGDAPSLHTVRDGRPDLEGPLAHYVLGVSGSIYVVAAGRCNHAGESLRPTYQSSRRIGIEAEAIGLPGAKGDWPAPQMDAYARLCAALVDEFDLAVTDVRGHKETCSPPHRKSDPSFDMGAFRDRVAAVNLRIKRAQQEDDVSFQDRHKLTAADVAAYGVPGLKVGDEKSYEELVRFPPAVARLRRESAAQIGALITMVSKLTAAVTNGGTLTEEQVTAAAEAGARAALAELGDALDG
jgi:hypothetical protein